MAEGLVIRQWIQDKTTLEFHDKDGSFVFIDEELDQKVCVRKEDMLAFLSSILEYCDIPELERLNDGK